MGGLFISFEGIDGSGKSTHLRNAAAFLESRGYEVVSTREPGGTELGQRIRQVFLEMEGERIDGRVELLLVSAARREHLQKLIEPALAEGKVVLSDRYNDSTWAYQGAARGLREDLIEKVDQVATDGRRPDLTLLFDLPPEVAMRRSRSGVRLKHGEVNRLDEEGLDFYRRARQGFLDRAALDPYRFKIIDSKGDPRQVKSRMIEVLQVFLAEGGSF